MARRCSLSAARTPWPRPSRRCVACRPRAHSLQKPIAATNVSKNLGAVEFGSSVATRRQRKCNTRRRIGCTTKRAGRGRPRQAAASPAWQRRRAGIASPGLRAAHRPRQGCRSDGRGPMPRSCTGNEGEARAEAAAPCIVGVGQRIRDDSLCQLRALSEDRRHHVHTQGAGVHALAHAAIGGKHVGAMWRCFST